MMNLNEEYEAWITPLIKQSDDYPPIVAWCHLDRLINNDVVGDPSIFKFHTMFNCLKSSIETAQLTLECSVGFQDKRDRFFEVCAGLF